VGGAYIIRLSFLGPKAPPICDDLSGSRFSPEDKKIINGLTLPQGAPWISMAARSRVISDLFLRILFIFWQRVG